MLQSCRRLMMSFVVAIATAGPLAAQAPAHKSADQAARRVQAGNLVGHGGPVKAIASDGARYITGSFDYSAILWSTDTAKPLLRLADHNGAVNAVAFVPRRNRALTAGDDSRVALWDLDTGKLLHRFEGHDAGSKIVGVSVSRDGTWAVSAGWDRTARLWNLDTLTAGPVLRDHRGPVNAAVFAEADDASATDPAAKPFIYTASYDGEIRAFAVADGALVRRVYAAGQSVNVLINVFDTTSTTARHDKLLFGTVAGASGILNAQTGEIIRTFPDLDRPILSATDGVFRVAIGSGDGRVRIFEKGRWSLEHELRAAFGPVWALAFSGRPSSDMKNNEAALYHAGLDDFVSLWPFAPRAAFDHVDTSQYPRRFQVAGTADTAVGRGEIQFARKCSICHTLTPDSANRAGPTLHNIFGRRIATLAGYPYSPELKTLDIVWNAETISKLFELGPDKFTPGSKMPLQVMSNQTERDDLIAFLQGATNGDAAPVDAKPATPQKSP